jgi:hypothetical protein
MATSFKFRPSCSLRKNVDYQGGLILMSRSISAHNGCLRLFWSRHLDIVRDLFTGNSRHKWKARDLFL